MGKHIIGFMDFEYNSDKASTITRQIFDIIEVGFYAYDVRSKKIVGKYHTYVKPVNNDGLLFDSIKELTGITQAQADSGVSVEVAFDKLSELTKNISRIYVWGFRDVYVLRKNLKNIARHRRKYRDIVWKLTSKFTDLGKTIEKKFGFRNSISLLNACYIYDIRTDTFHNALDDSMLTVRLFEKIRNEDFIKERLSEYRGLDKKRSNGYSIRLTDGRLSLVESAGVKRFEDTAQKPAV